MCDFTSPTRVALAPTPRSVGVARRFLRERRCPHHHAEVVDAAVASMTTLNAEAAEIVRGARPHAVTDVTGFGLVGHAREVAEGAGLRAEIDFAAVELLPGVRELIAEGHIPGGTRTNLELAAAYAEFGDGLDEADRLLACDAQTSGGLLVALPAERAKALPWPVIGRLGAGPAGTVLVH